MTQKKIEKLTDLSGVGETTAEKLTAGGLGELLSIAVSTPVLIAEKSGMTEAKARLIIQEARDACEFGFSTATQMKKDKASLIRIPTGSKQLDTLIGGGIEATVITEACGKFGSGKSQLAQQLCVNIQKMDKKFKAIYIDTENSFRANRIEQMAQAVGLDTEKVLENIQVVNVFNSDHQMFMVDQAEDIIKKDPNVRLLVVDSIIDHFRHEFAGRGQLADRQAKLNKHIHTLLRIAQMYHIAVYITNQVMEDPAMMYGDPVKAAGGNILSHCIRYRIYMRKSTKGITAKLTKSPDVADGEVIIQVTGEGIRDE